eukprot:4203138-Pyramimonas_sp.AAC.1
MSRAPSDRHRPSARAEVVAAIRARPKAEDRRPCSGLLGMRPRGRRVRQRGEGCEQEGQEHG